MGIGLSLTTHPNCICCSCPTECSFEDLALEMGPASGCDPVGAVCEGANRHLPEADQLALAFATLPCMTALRWLFHFGANPLVCDKNGTTLLHAACREGSARVVKELLSIGLSHSCQDNAGWTPLHIASVMGRFDVSRMLLEARAALHCRNLDGKTPEDICSTAVLRTLFRRRENFKSDGSEITCEMPVMSTHYFHISQERVVTFSLHDSEIRPSAMRLIRHSPGKGIALLIVAGIVEDKPQKINDFLIREEGVDVSAHSELLCGDFPLAVKLRIAFIDGMPLRGTGVLSALETFFCQLTVPTDLRKLALITGELARQWWLRHTNCGEPCASKTRHAWEATGFELKDLMGHVHNLQGILFSAVMLHGHARDARFWKSQVPKAQVMTMTDWFELNAQLYPVKEHLNLKGIYTAMMNGEVPLCHAPLLWHPPQMLKGDTLLNLPVCWATVTCNDLETTCGPCSTKFLRQELFGDPSRTEVNLNMQLHLQAALLLMHPTSVDMPSIAIMLDSTSLRSVDATKRLVTLEESRLMSVGSALSDAAGRVELCLLSHDCCFSHLRARSVTLTMDPMQPFQQWLQEFRHYCKDVSSIKL
eukprot:NODE_3155_length_2082_cov_4.832225.p1 GENE.NODE_3155_length_2082_cov_4.832225~~NODE_3155_length_2082_cov_4.832225.p1  ORF type:complete len:591 (+),score=114.15 NODE_3155_length_2082_cov_4.832225:104-1876(+)